MNGENNVNAEEVVPAEDCVMPETEQDQVRLRESDVKAIPETLRPASPNASFGRRVRLVRDAGGGYEIFMGSRRLAGFCAEWEDATRYHLPMSYEQQVRILVEPLGRAMPSTRIDENAPQDENVERDARLAEIAAQLEERGMRVEAVGRTSVPGRTHYAPSIIEMWNELPVTSRTFLAGQIEANYREMMERREAQAREELEGRMARAPAEYATIVATLDNIQQQLSELRAAVYESAP